MPEGFSNAPSELITVSRQQDAGLTRWQLTPEDILMELEHDLRGETYDTTKQCFVAPDDSQATLNEYGIRRVISIVRSKINKITFLSNLDEQDIGQVTLDVNLTLITLLFSRYHEFEMKKEEIEIVLDQVVHLVYMGLMRAKDEGERKFLGKAEKRMEVFKYGSDQHSRDRVSSIFTKR